MKRELLILRHGKSDWSRDLPDYDRPLKKRGKLGAQRIGAWLQEQGLEPDQVLSSPAERALTTAEKCIKSMGQLASWVHSDKRLYLADVETILGVLAEVPAASRRVLLVGHNPGLEDTVRHLARTKPAEPADGKLLPTATVARLAFEGDWTDLGRHQADLLQIVRAKSLGASFPFPHGGDAREWRDRPAYYYRQSAIVPYRLSGGKPEVLLIGSSGRKHWSVPKGIVEPGMTEVDSACREAEEEAGVRGEVTMPCLGRYRYPKWGATCEVSVFALEVADQLSDDEWHESHRGRQWMAPEEACRKVRQPELASFIRKLAWGLS